MKTLALATALCACLVSQMALGDVVVPAGTDTAEGNAENCIPFNCFAAHYQQVYSGASFGSGLIKIAGIAFRGDASFGNASGSYAATIGLSTTAAAVDGLSMTFADNVGADASTVFSGVVTIATTAGPGPRPFLFVINFTSPFDYDPTSGNLLLDVVTDGTTIGDAGTGFLDSAFTTGDDISRLIGDSPSAIVGIAADTGGLVTKFITAAAAPEPTTLALLSLGLAGVGFARRKR